jgi:dipeptidyl aminopeptidase/acylaminoacyl peptidase
MTPSAREPAFRTPQGSAARWRVIGLLALLGASLGSPTQAQDAEPAGANTPRLAPGPQLRAEGLPPIPRLPRAEAPAARSLRFVDWHPQRAEMLVVAGGGNESAGTPQLHRLREPGARPQPLTRERHAVQRALWEPRSGAYLVYSRDTDGDEAWRLFRLDPEGREAPVPLTPAHLRVADYAFLPEAADGRNLAVLLTTLDRRAARASDDDDKGDDKSDEGSDRRAPAPGDRQARTELWRLDPLRPEAAPQVLARAEGTRLSELRVLANGDLTLLHSAGRGSRLWRHPWRGGPPLPITGRGENASTAHGPVLAEAGPPSATPPGLLWTRPVEGDFRSLAALDAESGQRTRYNAGPAADLEGLAVPPPGGPPRPLALVHNEQGLSVLRLFLPKDGAGELRRPGGVPQGVIGTLAWHPQLPLLAFNHVSPQSPGRPWVLDLERGEVQPWSASAQPAGSAQPELRTLRWKSFDGTEITALHIAPPAQFSGPRPVFIEIHGGPSSQARPSFLQGTPRHLVQEMGMHLVLPNVRGSEGFGRRFLDLDNGRQREDAVRDISGLLDHLATLPGVDAGRVVVAGGSYGGYMALAVAAAENARILGAIDRVGISNFVSLLENTESYRRDNRRLEYGDERDPAMRAFLNSISPLNRVAQMKKPMFIVHGRNDPRVPWREADQIVQALRAQGTAVWFLTGENEGHGFSRADNRNFLHHATVEFVQRLLAGRPVSDPP